MIENENGTLTDMSGEGTQEYVNGAQNEADEADKEDEADDADFLADGSEETSEKALDLSAVGDVANQFREREEYEDLIKNRFKDFYAEDIQKLINKRFKRYRALEEKLERLESEAQRYANVDSVISAEVEKAVAETEQRMMRFFQKNKGRVSENATNLSRGASPMDVSKLTKSQRASLANRAQNGEMIEL